MCGRQTCSLKRLLVHYAVADSNFRGASNGMRLAATESAGRGRTKVMMVMPATVRERLMARPAL